MIRYQHILVPVDGSNSACKAVDYAFELAVCSKATIDFLYVADVHPLIGYRLTKADHYPQTVMELGIRAGNAVLDKIFGRMPDGIQAKRHFVEGRPAEEILEFADQNETDLIIIGSRGLGIVEQAFLGSVSRRVIGSAKCPVMVVRLPEF